MNESRGRKCVETSYQTKTPEINASRRIEGTAVQEGKTEEEHLGQQLVAETAHSETKASILDVYRKSMQESRKKELSSTATSERLNVLSVEEYSERFPHNNPLVMGHCDSEGNIYIKAVSENAVSHISTHETVHLCANRESGFNENGNWSIKSGLRETEFAPNRTLISDAGRGVNEGATEMYTLRELNRRGDNEAAQAMGLTGVPS